jgi:hypothetical protein
MRLTGNRIRAFLLLGTLVLVLVAGCGQDPGSGGTADDQPSVLPTPSPSPSASEYVAPITTMGAGGLEDASPSPLGLPAFEQAMAAYCTDYYTSRREAEKKYSGPNQESRIAFAKATAAAVRRTERQLDRLTPPPKLAAVFTQFLDNAHRITEARESMLSSIRATGKDGLAADDYDEAVTERWALASQLHAPLCDGQLPASQAAAVVAVAREWATNDDPLVVCRELVTPWFTDDESSCVHIRTLEDTPPYALPDDIAVQSLTGVDELTATISYLKLGGCACDPAAYLRLFFVAGEWKVNVGDLHSTVAPPR